MRRGDEFQNCHAWLRRSFRAATDKRSSSKGLEWVESERLALAIAANEWAGAKGLNRSISTSDIEAIEGRAVGHIDYASKLCLYVAELLYDRRPTRYPKRNEGEMMTGIWPSRAGEGTHALDDPYPKVNDGSET